MRSKSGVGLVGTIVLIVVIAACLGFIVLWVARGGKPAVVESPSPEELKLEYACVAEGCGWTGVWSTVEEVAAGSGKGIKGTKELWKCPQCGKFSVGAVVKCAKCGEKYIDVGTGCSKCARQKTGG